jgi:hypothetical protein
MKKSVAISSILILNCFLLNISEAALSVNSQKCVGYGDIRVMGAPPMIDWCPGLEEFRLPPDIMGGGGACARVACDTKAYGKWGVLDYRIKVIYTENSAQILRIDKDNKETVLIMDYRNSAHLDLYPKPLCKSEIKEGARKVVVNLEDNKTVMSLERLGGQSFNYPYFECSDPGFTKVVMHPTCVNDTLYKEESSKQGSSKQ